MKYMYDIFVEQCLCRSITELEIAREELYRHNSNQEAIVEINSALHELNKALKHLTPNYEERITLVKEG